MRYNPVVMNSYVRLIRPWRFIMRLISWLVAVNLGVGAPIACLIHCAVDDEATHSHGNQAADRQATHHSRHGHFHPEIIAVQFTALETPQLQAPPSGSAETPWFCHHTGSEPAALFPAVLVKPMVAVELLIVTQAFEITPSAWTSWHKITPLRPPIRADLS